MRPSLFVFCLVAVAAVVGVASVAQAQDSRCSNPGLTGSWAYTETGVVVAPAPLGTLTAVAVGRYTFAPDGTFVGTQFSSTAGQGVGPDTKEGTYTLNDDCTATLTLKAYRAGVMVRQSTWEIVLADNATEMHGIMTSLLAWVPAASAWVPLQPVMTLKGTRLFRDRGHGLQ